MSTDNEPGFNLNKMKFICCIWFGKLPHRAGDLMGMLYKKLDDKWEATYRMRYYQGTKDPFDGTDKKSWYTVDLERDPNPEDAEIKLSLVFSIALGGNVQKIMIAGGIAEFLEVTGKYPEIFHFKVTDVGGTKA